jgi:hypothetical protein
LGPVLPAAGRGCPADKPRARAPRGWLLEEWLMRYWMLWSLMSFVGAAVAQPTGVVPLDLHGLRVEGQRLLTADDREAWRLALDEGRGGSVLPISGGLVCGGERYGEVTATLADTSRFADAACAFEIRFTLAHPPGFYAHMLFFSPRVVEPPTTGDPGSEKAYRISYQFLGPSRFANNCTGFFLHNTATAAFRQDPLYAPPLAGARYRLAYGREYVAICVVRDVPAGVRLQFYLHDPTLDGDDAQPLIDFTDTSPDRLTAAGGARVQVGTGGLIHPATPVCFRGLRLYPPDQLAAARADRPAIEQLPAGVLAPPAEPQATVLPNLFSDNLVLQRNEPIPIWGRGIDGDTVQVTFAGERGTATVAGGQWMVRLGPLPAGGPYELTVTGRDRTLSVKNVMLGEVWVLGGQSNMCWGLESTTEAATEVPASNYPNLRVFMGWHPAADQPQFEMAGGRWRPITPALEGRFSAVGYYFGKALLQHLNVPIGLLDTSTPATGIEDWLSWPTAQRVWGDQLYACPNAFASARQDPSVFYNGKVAPLTPAGIAGMVWYQGDGSTPAVGYAYREYIPALIHDWRTGFE